MYNDKSNFITKLISKVSIEKAKSNAMMGTVQGVSAAESQSEQV